MKLKIIAILIFLTILTISCASTYQPTQAGTIKLAGKFVYTNDFVLETYFVEHAVALVDMHGFIIRDREWEIPVEGQVLGFMKLDKANKKADFQINLPAVPEGFMNDLSRSTIRQTGVQVFSVGYWGNLTGGPYAEGDDESQGWPDYLTSTTIDNENKNEVIGGKLVVWAPDADQKFPTGFGMDNLLFTADDPLGNLPVGYSVIDLDKKPFSILRSPEENITLYEPKDLALKDFSKDSYSVAFDKMFKIARVEYAFNNISGKQPDWDTVYAKIAPEVKVAEQNQDRMAFYLALKEFTMAFKDGHVGLSGGDSSQEDFLKNAGGGFGLAIRELDDGKVITTFVMNNGPAARAGIQVGAEITRFYNEPISAAINKMIPISGPSSTDFGYRYDQVRFLLRRPEGFTANVTFKNNTGTEQTVALTAIQERDSLVASSPFSGYDPNALPVEYQINPQGIGYVRINSNYDDLNLIIRLFQRSLKTFKDNELPAVIIDLRKNTGGSPLGLAGFLYGKEIPLGQLEYYSEKTKAFDPEGPRQKVIPNQEQFKFDKMALLVSQSCYSACEIEAYGFSQIPGMIVVGQTPSGGTEAEVARGDFLLPEGMSLQIPTGRFTLSDGSIFLEGKGVEPTVRVPITREIVLGNGDPVLDAAIKALTQ